MGFLVIMRSVGLCPHTQTGKSGGQVQPAASSENSFLTMRSSSEWKVMTASLPPGTSSSAAARSAGVITSSSALTDPYGLKCTLRGIAGGRCKPCGNYRAADICKLRGRFYRCVGTNLAYPSRDLSRKPLLAETRNNIGDLVLRICIDDNGGSKCRAVVHTHVERSVMNIRKAALGCVELI